MFNKNRILYLVLILTVCFFKQAVFASRAVNQALQAKNHFFNPEILYAFPTKALDFSSFINLEFGKTTTSQFTESSYGLFHYSNEKQNSLIVSLGRTSEVVQYQRQTYNTLSGDSLLLPQNPIGVVGAFKFEGVGYAAGISYSDYRDSVNELSETSAVAIMGFRLGQLSLSTELAIPSKIISPKIQKVQFFNSFLFQGLYEIDQLIFSVKGSFFKFERFQNQIENLSFEDQSFEFSFSDKLHIYDQIFYYKMDLFIKSSKSLISDVTYRENSLPLTLGFESQMNDWLSFRSSIRQTLILASDQDHSATPNNTTAAAGVTLSYGSKLKLDAILSGLVGRNATQNLNENELLSQASLTYYF